MKKDSINRCDDSLIVSYHYREETIKDKKEYI